MMMAMTAAMTMTVTKKKMTPMAIIKMTMTTMATKVMMTMIATKMATTMVTTVTTVMMKVTMMAMMAPKQTAIKIRNQMWITKVCTPIKLT